MKRLSKLRGKTMKLPLTATVLNKRSSITIIGSVGDYQAEIELTLADQSIVRPDVDENGSFVIDIDWKKAHGDIFVKAMLPEHPEVTNETVLHVQAPEPIVTAVLSTQGIMRKLTGSVNQPGLFIEVHTPENTHPIEVLIDDKLEFELQIPIALRPEDLRVTALNPVTGEQMEVPVEIGVTTKTMTIPILTDDMINSYADAAEGRRAASAAYDHSLMEKAAASESFVNSIVESISTNENTQNRAEAEDNQATKANSPFEDDMEPVVETSEAVLTDNIEQVVKLNEIENKDEVEDTIFVEQLIPNKTVQVEILQPSLVSVPEKMSEQEDGQLEDEDLENKQEVIDFEDENMAVEQKQVEEVEFEDFEDRVNSRSVDGNDQEDTVFESRTSEEEFSEGDEQVATATGVAEVMRDGDYKPDLKIPEPRPKEVKNQEIDEPSYSRTQRSKAKPKKGGLIAFLKRLFSRKSN